MPTYISLCKWTQQGVKTVKESPTRLDGAKKGLAKHGVKILNFYMVTGVYDLVIVCEAPNFEVMAKAMLSTMSVGSITTETSRAFTEDEYRAIIGSL